MICSEIKLLNKYLCSNHKYNNMEQRDRDIIELYTIKKIADRVRYNI